MVYINEYLNVLLVVKAGYNIGEKELNEILLNSMPNVWIKQACVQGFYCETITFKICNYDLTYVYFWSFL